MPAVHRPFIGVSSYARDGTLPGFAVPCGYVDAIRRAGGIPIALLPGDPDPDCYLDMIEGLILIGGGDIDPQAYGGNLHPTVYAVSGERDAFELTLARAVLNRQDIPVLCVCRGMQILNVACGGDLYTHIPETVAAAVVHRREPPSPIDHAARIEPASRLAAILGATTITVRSWHHQAVRKLGTGLRAVAWAPDELVEALEHDTHPWCLAVQWHPELQPDDPTQRRLFSALVTSALVSYQRNRAQDDINAING